MRADIRHSRWKCATDELIVLKKDARGGFVFRYGCNPDYTSGYPLQ